MELEKQQQCESTFLYDASNTKNVNFQVCTDRIV